MAGVSNFCWVALVLKRQGYGFGRQMKGVPFFLKRTGLLPRLAMGSQTVTWLPLAGGDPCSVYYDTETSQDVWNYKGDFSSEVPAGSRVYPSKFGWSHSVRCIYQEKYAERQSWPDTALTTIYQTSNPRVRMRLAAETFRMGIDHWRNAAECVWTLEYEFVVGCRTVYAEKRLVLDGYRGFPVLAIGPPAQEKDAQELLNSFSLLLMDLRESQRRLTRLQ